MAKVLVIEDEVPLTEVIGAYLRQAGYQVEIAHEGWAGLEMALEGMPDLIILDLMLPGLSGEEIGERLRRETAALVLILTAKGGESDRVRGLEWADDYMVKPFSPRELVARVGAILRRAGLTEGVSFGQGYTLDTVGHRVLCKGEEIPLTPTEFRLLQVLLSQPGRVFTKGQLAASMGTDEDTAEETLYVHVKNLRQKIEVDPRNPRFVQTIRGVGYRFAKGEG